MISIIGLFDLPQEGVKPLHRVSLNTAVALHKCQAIA